MSWRTLAGAALERGLHHPLRAVPSGAGSALGAWLGRRVVPGLYPVATARARETLARLRPDLETGAALEEAWANIAASFAEIPRILRFRAEGRVEIEGAAHLRAARDAGRPLMVAGVHTGNPELLGIALAWLGMRPVGVAVRQPTGFRERVITDIRLRAGGRLIRADRDAMRPALAVLREQAARETLLFWMDEHVGGVVRGPSLGRGTLPPNGNIALAARLARLSGAVIVPGHVRRLPGTRFLVRFLPPVAMPPAPSDGATGNGAGAEDRAAAVAAGAAAIDAAVDPVVRDLLPQWLHVIVMRP